MLAANGASSRMSSGTHAHCHSVVDINKHRRMGTFGLGGAVIFLPENYIMSK